MRMRVKDRAAFEKKERELFEFAHSYLSEAFPNPDREGCPPDAALRSLAFNPKDRQPIVTEHLAACSPCFRRYSELLAELKSQREAEKEFSWERISAWTKANPVLAGTAAFCVLLIVIGAGLLFQRIRVTNTPPLETHETPAAVEPVNPTVAYSPFILDLSTLSPVRGSESPATGAPQRIRVPSLPLDLTVILPIGSEEPTYNVRLASDGHTFWSKPAHTHLHKGKTLIQIEADFRQIPDGNYNLEVQSSTGIRLVQLVSVQAALPRSGEQKP